MGKPTFSETNIFEKPKKFNDYFHLSVYQGLKFFPISNEKTRVMFRISDSRPSQVAIYTVFHEESESAVRNLRKPQENPKK